MKILSKAEVLGADDLERATVEVPEWGKDAEGNPACVMIRMIMAKERDAFEASMNNGTDRNLANLRARLCALCIVDADGARLFRDEADIKSLGEKSAKAVDRIFDACRKLNGMTNDEVEELEKNLSSSPGESSSSS